MKVTFLDVGQGDSIILEWSKDRPHICIIDCHQYLDRNKTIEWLKKFDYKIIDLIILSHPHTDHFSGLPELLKYCIEEGIKIQAIKHAGFLSLDYLQFCVNGINPNRLLQKFFELGTKLQEETETDYSYLISSHWPATTEFAIPDCDWTMVLHSPTSSEQEKFLTGYQVSNLEEDPENNPLANWLSSVIQVRKDGHYFLLTSDVEKDVQKRIGIDGKSFFDDQTLLLGQLPHHGSSLNYYRAFWNTKPRLKPTHIVISVGRNGYGHPSIKTLADLRKYGYEPHLTNPNRLHKPSIESSALDVFASLIEKPSNSNQFGISFEITDNFEVYPSRS
jgi:beta-lactamase superfamily II metal-dependent hydrolase